MLKINFLNRVQVVSQVSSTSKYLPLCSSEERNSYRFAMTQRWVNDDFSFLGELFL